MSNQLYKDLVDHLGFLANIVEVSKHTPEMGDPIAQADYRGFIAATSYQVADIADLLLKAEPNRLETTTYQNWDN